MVLLSGLSFSIYVDHNDNHKKLKKDCNNDANIFITYGAYFAVYLGLHNYTW